jgi:quinolinate synthase
VRQVVDIADYVGSTEFIRQKIEQAPPGTAWAVGTEISMVNRLAKENPDKTIFCLDPIVCPCATMYRIHPAYLLWVLDGILAGLVINRISVPGKTKKEALLALERMLEISR